jgi:hypothetical protein
MIVFRLKFNLNIMSEAGSIIETGERPTVDELFEALHGGESHESLIERMSAMRIEELEGSFRLELAKKAGELAYHAEQEGAFIAILEELRQWAVGARAVKILSEKLTKLVGGETKVVSDANFGSVHRGGGGRAGMLGYGHFESIGPKGNSELVWRALQNGEFEGVTAILSENFNTDTVRFQMPIVCLLNMDVHGDVPGDKDAIIEDLVDTQRAGLSGEARPRREGQPGRAGDYGVELVHVREPGKES